MSSMTGRRCSSILGLVFAALTLGVATGQAAQPITVPESLMRTPRTVAVGTPQDVTAACPLGVTGKPAWPVDPVAPPDDAYYTLLDPETCGCPGSSGVLMKNAHVILDFAAGCSIPVSVAVVEADLTDKLCPVPVPGAYLCKPISYELSAREAGTCDFALALADGSCITQKAFLVVTLLENGNCKEPPKLVTTDRCEACTSYSVSKEGAHDLCKDLPGNPIMYVEATCCDEVPAHHATWGQVKTLYR
jgi:hypothetical protein